MFCQEDYCSMMEGFRLYTDKRIIEILISSDQSCCESFGYFATNDEDFSYYHDSELLGIDIVQDDEEGIISKSVMENYGISNDECIFVNVLTSNGDFQLAVYNSHNGYYGHSVLIRDRNCVYLSSSL